MSDPATWPKFRLNFDEDLSNVKDFLGILQRVYEAGGIQVYGGETEDNLVDDQAFFDRLELGPVPDNLETFRILLIMTYDQKPPGSQTTTPNTGATQLGP